MTLRRSVAGIAVVLCMNLPAMAAMNPIQNPADKISNPADNIYNPATQINNPASNIYNPATRMNNQNPLSPATQPVTQSTVTVVTPATSPAIQMKGNPQPQPRTDIRQNNYHFKTVGEYINAAKKAFVIDDYRKFLSITENALRRISAGTLIASNKTAQKLVTYRICGNELLKLLKK